MRRPSLLRRAVLALVLAAFPAMSTTMALGGPIAAGSAAETQGAHPGDCHGPHHHPAGQHHCCDLCSAACSGCSVHFGAPGVPAPAPVVTISAPLAAARASRPADRVPHLLPLPLGPPLRLA
jgi:hypothetical protein